MILKLTRLGQAVKRALVENQIPLGRKRIEDALRESEARYRDLVEHSHELIGTHDLDGRLLSVNRAAIQLLGYDERTLLGKNLRDLLLPEFRREFPAYLATIERHGVASGLLSVHTRAGERRVLEYHNSLRTADVSAPIVRFIAQDVTERRRAEILLQARVQQQAAVVALGQQALAGMDLATLFTETVSLVARTLQVEYCKLMEILADEDALLIRAGVGWEEGLVGQATVRTGPDTQAGYTLLSGGPVIVENLRTETRFPEPPFLREHGILSGLSVIVHGPGHPFGILAAHATRRRVFTADDVHFLQATANLLTMAIERKQAETERERLIVELQDALATVKTLSGFLPICASCKKIRDDRGYWNQIEAYIRDRTDAEFTHSICPECAKRLYPDFFKDDA